MTKHTKENQNGQDKESPNGPDKENPKELDKENQMIKERMTKRTGAISPRHAPTKMTPLVGKLGSALNLTALLETINAGVIH